MCVSGGFRTLATPAVSKALVDRMKRPLNADLFVFAGVGSLETRRHCPKKKSSSFEEPSREAIARWLGDASFVETVRRTAAVISPVAMRLVGCDGLESEWCLDAQAERTLYARAAGPCVDEAEVTTTSYAHGYHQWVLAAACFGLIEARGRYDFVVRWRPDAVWKGSILARGGRGSLDAWRFDKVLLGNHITAYCPAAQSPDCDLINDVFGVATWPVARAYFVGVFEIFRDEACRRDYVELARAARFECARDKSYPECKMATATRLSLQWSRRAPRTAMGTTKRIETGCVRKICSGQVIVDVATAIKELVENALDAGATRVDVKLMGSGCDEIEVSDNGRGIGPGDFEGVARRYATSKLRDFGDLERGVSSFGFRGEALASLCELAGSVEVVTRDAGASAGTRLKYGRDGGIVAQSVAPRAVGTTVTARDLFKPLPVRRADLERNAKRHFAKAVRLLQAYALVARSARLRVTNVPRNTKRPSVVLQAQAGRAMTDAVAALFGARFAATLEPLEDAKFEGLASRATGDGVGRAEGDRQFFFVNGRPIDAPKLARAANDVWRHFEMKHKPAIFLDLRLAPGNVDVNCAPDKREVVIDNENGLVAALKDKLHALWAPTSRDARAFVPGGHAAERAIDSFLDGFRNPRATESLGKPPRDLVADLVSPDKRRHDDENNKTPAASTPPDEPGAKEEQQHHLVREDDASSLLDDKDREPPTVKAARRKRLVLDDDDEDDEDDEGSKKRARREDLAREDEEGDSSPEKEPPQAVERRRSPPREPSPGRAEERSERKNDDDREVVAIIEDEESAEDREAPPPPPDVGRSKASKRKVKTASAGKFGSVGRSRRVKLDVRAALEVPTARAPRRSEEGVASTLAHASLEAKDEAARRALSKVVKKEDFARMRAVGQFNKGFIVARLDDSFFIVDQHAADEKYRYEMNWKSQVASQPLVKPLACFENAADELIVLDRPDAFEANGFRLRVDENASVGRRVEVTAVPVAKGITFGASDARELATLLAEASPEDNAPRLPKLHTVFASKACRSAVMIGTDLDAPRMTTLIRQLTGLHQPWNCPHGRPTMRHLTTLRSLEDKVAKDLQQQQQQQQQGPPR
ncbi:hypothetical protein CTAYLR_003549 [Chrysophaeum taylorii]|uniref:Uncharacterized protein n=1 Tax=Chrysophaeum taylorii TaxID=2483200 RepID=A0AAD7UL32_9STRA|nr:hypothetical protein CTAYLR_003549 [Chrysophaeum taylorii]